VREHEIYSVGYSTSEATLNSPAERARRSTDEALARNTAGNATTARLMFHVEKLLGNRPLAYATATFSALAFLFALITSIIGEAPQARQPQQTTAARTQVKAAKSPVTATRNVATDESSLANVETRKGDQSGSKQHASGADESGAQTNGDGDESAPKTKRRFLHLPFFGNSDDSEPKQTASSARATDPGNVADANTMQATDSAPDGQTTHSATSVANVEGETADYAAKAKPPAANGGHASVALAISPWGEVFVDGKAIGVSPPLNEIELLPGSRLIEIRNGDFPPFSQRVDLKAQQRIKIRYKFN